MSVNLMSAIFETEFFDLKDENGNVTKASTAKLILLAMADHANDEGEGAYPSIERLCRKTALSPQTIRNTFDALRYNGIILLTGLSKHGTNNHTINTNSFPKAIGKEVTVLTLYPLEGSNQSLLPLQPVTSDPLPVRPESLLTTRETPIGADAPKTDNFPLEWKVAHGEKPTTITEREQFLIDAKDRANLIDFQCLGAGPLAYAFMVARNLLLSGNEQAVQGHRKAAREMMNSKVKPEHVTAATKQLLESTDRRGKKITVADLFSVSKTAIGLANPAPTEVPVQKVRAFPQFDADGRLVNA